eukprot:3440927-Prymnesium_polylepis.1
MGAGHCGWMRCPSFRLHGTANPACRRPDASHLSLSCHQDQGTSPQRHTTSGSSTPLPLPVRVLSASTSLSPLDACSISRPGCTTTVPGATNGRGDGDGDGGGDGGGDAGAPQRHTEQTHTSSDIVHVRLPLGVVITDLHHTFMKAPLRPSQAPSGPSIGMSEANSTAIVAVFD